MMRRLLSYSWITIIFLSIAFGQSGPEYYRSAVQNANRVKTVFGNWGVVGQPVDTRPRGTWIFETNGYIGDVSLLIGADVKDPKTGINFKSVLTCPVSRPTTKRDEDPVTGAPWTLMPVNGYFNPQQQSIAMSTDPSTWPATWPDKMNDAVDPGWAGKWNGYFW
jgi:hypothetical protein